MLVVDKIRNFGFRKSVGGFFHKEYLQKLKAINIHKIIGVSSWCNG